MTYQEEGLYPIFLGKNEFALVTGQKYRTKSF